MKSISKMVLLSLVAALSAQAIVEPYPTDSNIEETVVEAQRDPEEQLPVPVNNLERDIGMRLFTEPLQMINPLAPESYGNGEQNVVRDPIDGRVVGVKALSLDF